MSLVIDRVRTCGKLGFILEETQGDITEETQGDIMLRCRG